MKIRAATHSDTGPIADIIQSVWPKQTPDPDQIYSTLINDTHQSFVADNGDVIVAADGCLRYELDLMAVLPSFHGQGFATDNLVQTLNVSSQSNFATVDAPDTLYIVAVQTFSYDGLWLENDFSEAALRYGQHRRTVENVGVVGVLIPTQQMHDDIRELGFRQTGEYHWWTRRL
ncbi:MAG: GNAT family N-acetyltransferase [Chloroflexi bacterium]|nr:GNAT family N-acetyltransferase [Chloroflexota bacterium]